MITPVVQVTHHIQIPLLYADTVIGASGANISYIRRASGASIAIQETRGMPGEMTVEINGSASQIQTAEQMIQVYGNFHKFKRLQFLPSYLVSSSKEASFCLLYLQSCFCIL